MQGRLIAGVVCVLVNITCLFSLYNSTVSLKEELATTSKDLQDQTDQVAYYEDLVYKIMDGHWEPGMGILMTPEDEWYGHTIFSFKAQNRPPGSPAIDVGEILDRHIEGEHK